MKPGRFRSVALAGGGSRCVWQGGFLDAAGPDLGLDPQTVAAVSGVSAGAAIAALYLSGRMDVAMDYIVRATGANRKNFYPKRLLGPEPAFPHYRIYRGMLVSSIDAMAMERFRSGPPLYVLLTRPPAGMGPRTATFFGFGIYSYERYVTKPMHPVLSTRAGFQSWVVDARECATPQDLADLVLASSSTPPFTPVMEWKGHIVLDGGLVDNIPVNILPDDTRDHLVLVSRQYPVEKLPHRPGCLYVQPSRPIPVAKWDYTNPEGLLAAWALGREDGARFVDLYRDV